MVGGWGDDVTNGGDGDDLMFANRGVDVHNGGEGNDRLWALARRDDFAVDGTGDTLNGGPGNDLFRTRDGQPDKIDCGPGIDTVRADFKDIIVDAAPASPNGSCEQVKTTSAPRFKDERDEHEADRDDDRYEKEGEKPAKRGGGRGRPLGIRAYRAEHSVGAHDPGMRQRSVREGALRARKRSLVYFPTDPPFVM